MAQRIRGEALRPMGHGAMPFISAHSLRMPGKATIVVYQVSPMRGIAFGSGLIAILRQRVVKRPTRRHSRRILFRPS